MSSDLLHAVDEAAVSDHGYSKMVGIPKSEGDLVRMNSSQTQSMNEQQQEQQELLLQRMNQQQQQHLLQQKRHAQNQQLMQQQQLHHQQVQQHGVHLPGQPVVTQDGIKQEQQTLTVKQEPQTEGYQGTPAINVKQELQPMVSNKQLPQNIAKHDLQQTLHTQEAHQVAVKQEPQQVVVKQEPKDVAVKQGQEQVVVKHEQQLLMNPSTQQHPVQPHIIRQKLAQQIGLQQQQHVNQNPTAQAHQHLYEQQLRNEDIKQKEQELARLQNELKKVQQQQNALNHMRPNIQARQEEELQQLQETHKQIYLQKQRQQQELLAKQGAASYMQSPPTTTIVTMPSSRPANPQNVHNIRPGVSLAANNQTRPQYVLQVSPQIQRAQNAAHIAQQQLAHANVARPGHPTNQTVAFQQGQHLSSQPIPTSSPRMPQLGTQRQNMPGGVSPNQQGTCSMPVVSQNLSTPGTPSHENTGFPDSLQRDCSDKVLLLPADSSDGCSTPNSLSQNSSLSQTSSSLSQNTIPSQTSSGADTSDVQTPPLVSSTSGHVVKSKSAKAARTPSTDNQDGTHCCPCKKKSKCIKCACCQQGGCKATCISPLCRFKFPNCEPPHTPRPKKPTAAVTPNVSGKKKGAAKGAASKLPDGVVLGAADPAASTSVQCAPGTDNVLSNHPEIKVETDLEPGEIAMPVQSNTATKTSDEQCRESVVEQTQSPVAFHEGIPVTSTTMGRQQAAQVLASMALGDQAHKSATPGESEQSVSPGTPQGPLLRACLVSPHQQQPIPQQGNNQSLVQGTVQDVQKQIVASRNTGTGTNTVPVMARQQFIPEAGQKLIRSVDGKYYLQVPGKGLTQVTLPSNARTVRFPANVVNPGANAGNQTNINYMAYSPDTSASPNQTPTSQPQQQSLLQPVDKAQSPALQGQPQQLIIGLQQGQGEPQPRNPKQTVTIKQLKKEGDEGGLVVGPTIVGGQGLQVGMEYKLDYQDGTSQITTWDGEHFRIKGSMIGSTETPGQVRGGGGGARPAQQRVIKGNATGLNMVQQRNTQTVKVLGRPEMSPQPGSSNTPVARRWVHSSVGKEQLSRRPLHVETPQGEAPEEPPANTTNADSSQAEQPPPPPPTLKRQTPTEDGKYAVCPNCGQLSSDYDICEGCSKILPDNPRFYRPDRAKIQRMDKPFSSPTVFIPSNNSQDGALVLVDKKKFYGDKNAEEGSNPVLYIYRGKKVTPAKGMTPAKRGGAGRGRGRGKPLPEPETVTILSSDDESGALSPPMSLPDGMEGRTGTPVPPASPAPSVSPAQSPAPTPLQSVTRRQKMEDASGQVIMPTQGAAASALRIDHRSFVNVAIESRSIRLGSLKGTPYEKVVMSHLGIDIKIEYESENLELRISSEEIVRILGHFGPNMPVMFVYTSPQCAARIRNICKMTTRSGPFFDPTSKEEPHRRITIIINFIYQSQVTIVREICRMIQEKHPHIARNLLREIEADQANITLVKSTPHFAVESMPVAVPNIPADYMGDDWVEDDEPYDRSRSPSPPRPIFSGPIIRLLTYPAPPATGGISVTNEDLFCLNEGEFLNDVIIDFYLKYVFFEILTEEQRKQTHIFSSFFYRRLTQRSKRNDEDLSLSLPQRRHARVRTWTRHVDLFSKDFIIVPINESAHWYLAVICYPHMRTPEYKNASLSNGLDAIKKEYSPPSPQSSTDTKQEPDEVKQETTETKEEAGTPPDPASGEEQMDTEDSPNNDDTASQAANEKMKTEQEETDMDTSEPADSTSQDAPSKPAVEITMKQPCILIFDSLAGPTRGTVIRTLREYMQIEWEAKKKEKCGARVFNRDTFKGGNPKCPQQTNFSDCGIYVLQYVEAFFESPIQDYNIPMKALANWFPEERVRRKREELKTLILTLMKKINPNLEYDPSKDNVT